MNTPAISPRELLLRSLRDHDLAAKHNMKIATEHLKRGYQIARELEHFEQRDHGGADLAQAGTGSLIDFVALERPK